MLVYIIATVLSVGLCAWLYPGKKASVNNLPGDWMPQEKRKRVISCMICMLPFLAVMSCRWNLGVDMWHTYTPGYLTIKSETQPLTEEEKQIIQNDFRASALWNNWYWWSDNVEQSMNATSFDEAYNHYLEDYHHTGIGFQLLQRGLVLLHADVQWFYFFTSLLVICLTFASIWLQSTRPAWACLFFVLTANFFIALSVVAQYIAVSICIFACVFAQKRKPILFFILIALAATFHYSAIVFIPVYFFSKLKVKPIWCGSAVIASLIIANFAFPLIQQLVQWIAPKYNVYINGLIGGAEFEWVLFGINCAVFILSTYYFEKGKDLPYFQIWYYMNVMGMIVLAFSGTVPWIKRINYYFSAAHFLFIPMILNLEERRKLRIILHIVTVTLFCAEIYIAIWLMNKHGTLPYVAFFQGNRVELMHPLLERLLNR